MGNGGDKLTFGLVGGDSLITGKGGSPSVLAVRYLVNVRYSVMNKLKSALLLAVSLV